MTFKIDLNKKATIVTRRGRALGVTAHIKAWKHGVRVYGYEEGQVEIFEVWITSGESGTAMRPLCQIVDGEIRPCKKG